LKLPKNSETCHAQKSERNYRCTWSVVAQIILFLFWSNFSKRKTILNVKNLENSIKAGSQMRTHEPVQQSSKAFDQS
jgi:hypothetical protein